MVKLSRAGWNNVIIFSVMLIILLINLSNDKLFNKDGTSQAQRDSSLLGAHAVILSLTINDKVTIERVGTGWRSTPDVVSGQALEQMMQTWQSAQGVEPADVDTSALEAADMASQRRVSVTVAGRSQPITLILLPGDNELVVFNDDNKQALLFPLPIYRQLIPFEIM